METYESIKKQRETALKQIFDHFKASNQLAKLQEEVAEFSDAYKAFYLHEPSEDNWEHLIEELADVCIVLEEFRLTIADDAHQDGRLFHTPMECAKAEKIQRTIERIKEGYYER